MFQGLRVLELASVLAGPSVGQFFAELGADVIKIENSLSGGDVTRSWKGAAEKTDDRSAYFCSVNWGKRSVALDLTKGRDREIVHELARRSSVVIASYKPGDASRLGVDYPTLSALNPAIIYGQITGYGSHHERVGYDAVLQAEAGFMFMNGEPGGKSLKMPVALIDILAAHHLKEGILLAMINRSRTGTGGFVEVSLLQAAVSSLANQAMNWLIAGSLPGKQGSAHPNIAPYGETFRTRDEQEIILAVGNDKQFTDLCTILQVNSLADDLRFARNPARVENRSELGLLLKERIAGFDADVLMDLLMSKKIPAGQIQSLRQVFEMDEARQLLFQAGSLYGLRTYAGEQSFASRNELLPPPHLGEHNERVLAELN